MTAKLNAAQRQAVQTLEGPLLVLAGAGTGKTRVVTYRIAELIRHGIRPERILAVTFTNKAAAEMQQRVGQILGRRVKARPRISTFHSQCVQILRRHIRQLGYPERFAIYNRGDQENLARAALREIRVPGELLRPADLLACISRWKTLSVRPSDAARLAGTDKEHLAAMAYRRYQKALKHAGAVDFDDLLLCTEDLFAQFPDIRREEAARFDHLLIDEYQDTNGSQYRIVRQLSQEHRNLCVVGDDDQSIYGWRGAEVEHILRFTRDWPDATVVRLEQNYRCTSAILELANRLIVFNKNRHDKILRAARPGGEKPRIEQYRDETEEARSVVMDICRRLQQGAEPNDFAILFRTNEQPRTFEIELRRARVPYVLIGGMSFYDRKEVQDVLAYLRLLDSPNDEVSLLRIINKPPRGIGGKTVETVMERAVAEGKTAWDVICSPGKLHPLPSHAVEALQRFADSLKSYRRRLRARKGQSLVDLARDLIDHFGYRAELERQYPDGNERESRWASVEEVVNSLATYERRSTRPTLQGFLDEVALSGRELEDEKDSQLRRNAVAIMTLHSAKGLEFSDVYLVGLEEGLLPHHRSVAQQGDAVDEERRLCYVGITRAQERLTLSMALSRMKWGRPRQSHPSRFLFEMIGRADSSPAPRPATTRRR